MEQQPVRLLYVSNDAAMAAVIMRVCSHYALWQAVAADTDAALDHCRNACFDVVLLGPGLKDDAEQQLIEALGAISTGTSVVQYYGGGSGLLYSTVQAIVARR